MIKIFLAVFILIISTSYAATTKYDGIIDFARTLSETYPQTTSLLDLGPTDSGVSLIALQIGNGPAAGLIVAAHHGNEGGGVEVAKAFAASLAKRPILTKTLYVIPVLNIDGYNRNSRFERVGNRSYDPNRNYPGPCPEETPFTLKSTKLLAEFIEQKGIVVSATLHTYWPAVAYPWGMDTKDVRPPYEDIFKQLVFDATVDSKYATGNSTEVIYGANGTFEDYAFWKSGIWSILFELGTTHNPNTAQVDKLIRDNVNGLRLMFERAPMSRADNHSFHGTCSRGDSLSRP